MQIGRQHKWNLQDPVNHHLCLGSKLWTEGIFKDKDKDSFIGPEEFVVGYSKAPEQPQSSARPVCHSHTMTSTGREPATIRIAAYRSSPRYALRHGRSLVKFAPDNKTEAS